MFSNFVTHSKHFLSTVIISTRIYFYQQFILLLNLQILIIKKKKLKRKLTMDDFQPVINRKGKGAIKYPPQHQLLVSMSFKSAAVSSALEASDGDINGAIIILLTEIETTEAKEGKEKEGGKDGKINNTNEPTNITAQNIIKEINNPMNTPSKNKILILHNKIMSCYKVQKCKILNSHDVGKCVYWHTKADRRRNPFLIPFYGCMECSSDQFEVAVCPAGDTCIGAHNKHEKMFHPDIFKVKMIVIEMLKVVKRTL